MMLKSRQDSNTKSTHVGPITVMTNNSTTHNIDEQSESQNLSSNLKAPLAEDVI